MQMDPPILPASPPPANLSPIVGWILGFNSMDVAAPLQPCSHPRLENTCLVDPRPDSEESMVDELESQGLDTSKDPTGLEVALCNSSLDVYKDVFLYRRSFDDDDEDGGQDRQEGGGTDDHVGVTAINSTGALENPHLNSGGVSG